MKEGMVCYETPDHQHEQRIRLYLLLLYDLQGNRVMAICAGENWWFLLFEKITTRHTDSVLCGVFVVQSRCRERSPVAGIGKE